MLLTLWFVALRTVPLARTIHSRVPSGAGVLSFDSLASKLLRTPVTCPVGHVVFATGVEVGRAVARDAPDDALPAAERAAGEAEGEALGSSVRKSSKDRSVPAAIGVATALTSFLPPHAPSRISAGRIANAVTRLTACERRPPCAGSVRFFGSGNGKLWVVRRT